MAGDPAELAYGHALAMLGDPDAAAYVAISALRRAGRARRLVLAHARYQAVARATQDEPVDTATIQLVVLDLHALAATLASTRPPDERAALDLRARTAGDLAVLGVALGLRPTAAAHACNDIAAAWEAELDPALLAFSGAADCAGLATILDAAEPDTVAELLALAPAVRAHAESCVGCTDRMRAMNAVRTFFSPLEVDVPSEVREASRASRSLRPSAPPPPLFEDTTTIGKLGRVVTVERFAAAAGIAIALAGLWIGLDRRDHKDKLANLTKVAKSAPVTLGVASFDDKVAKLDLHNGGTSNSAYTVTASVPWVRITPRRGTVVPRETQVITVTALDSAPEGDSRTIVTVTTASGATTTQELNWHVEHPPDLAASADGCTVNVNVVEESNLASLVLHWRDTTEHQVDITHNADGYSATLTPEGQPITYWVTATDARGNAARTTDQTIPANAC